MYHSHSKGARRGDPDASWLATAYPHIADHSKADAIENTPPAPTNEARPGRASRERATNMPCRPNSPREESGRAHNSSLSVKNSANGPKEPGPKLPVA